MSRQPTPEQQAIFDHLRNTPHPLIIDAKAGSGKTTTLIEALPILAEQGDCSLQAFNRSIADELKQRVGALGFMVAANVSVSTVHSHGLSAFRKAGRKPQTLSGKLNFMLKDQIANYPDDDPIRRNTRHITRLVSLAKQTGFGLTSCDGRVNFPSIADHHAWELLIEHYALDTEFEGDFSIDDCIEEAQTLLKASNARIGSIDFDDMIYLPLLLNLNIPRFQTVMIDEAQDINATRAELAFRSVKPGERIIAVGDPHQAIYGFTGALTDSLDQIRQRCGSEVVTLPLSICWRCDDKVLDEAREIVPGIKTSPAKLGKGSVRHVRFRYEGDGSPVDRHERLDPPSDFLALPRPGDAILCRLNKPNVAVCLGLLRRGVSARIEGRDLGKRLLDHGKRATDLYSFQPLTDTIDDLRAYLSREIAKLAAKQREAAIGILEDEVDALILIAERVIETSGPKAEWPMLEALVANLFGDDLNKQVVTLSSIHKAKGREWPRVFILGRDSYMPFHRATLPWELQQEQNLIYVAVTRAEHELIYVTGVQSAIDKGLHREPPLAAVQA